MQARKYSSVVQQLRRGRLYFVAEARQPREKRHARRHGDGPFPDLRCKDRVMPEDVVIVGAGPAGLAAAHELRRTGIAPHLIDQADRVASSWRRRHDQLRLNTHRWFSHQPGRRIARHLGAYPARDDYVAYLEDYLAWSGIEVEFGVTANRIDRGTRGGWHVDTDADPLEAGNVIVATGSDRLPWTPAWPGLERYRGKLLHAGEFRHADDFAGKRVLLVGAGNSGVDIGNHLAAVDIGPSWVSVRNGPTIAPQYVFGIPMHPLLVGLRWLPIKLQDFNVRLVSRLALGDLAQYGMPRPPKGALTRQIEDGVTLSVDNGFTAALKQGRFEVVPPIESLDERLVHLQDGRVLEPEAIICATGYRLGLEPLVGHLDVLDERGRPRWIADRSSPDHAGLWFLGQNSSTYGNMHIRRGEARRLARIIHESRACGTPSPRRAAVRATREEET